MGFWDKFFNRYGSNLPPDGAIDTWRKYLETLNYSREDYVVSRRFLSLAYWLSRSDEALEGKVAERIAEDLNIPYPFNKPKPLKEELHTYGIELLKSGKNHQYLRTLSLCSGKFYELFATEVGKLFRSQGLDKVIKKGFLEKKLEDFAKKYDIKPDQENKDLLTLADIGEFFRKLFREYQEKGELTLETIQRVCSLPAAVAQAVLNNLFSQTAAAESLLCPSVGINIYNNIVYVFPESYVFEEGTPAEVTFFVKEFAETGNDVAHKITYTKINSIWRCVSKLRKFKLSRYRCIEKFSGGTYKDVTPVICRNNAILLFKLIEKNGIYELARGKNEDNILLPGNSVARGCTYKVCFLKGGSETVQYFISEDSTGEETQESCDITNGIFNVPDNCMALQIGDWYFQCKDDDIVLSEHVDIVTDRSEKNRLFFFCSVAPVREIFRYSNCEVVYCWENNGVKNETVLYSSETKQWVIPIPQECRWQRGRLYLKTDGKIKRNRPVTFLDDISFVDAGPVDISEEKEITLCFGDETEKHTVKKECEFLEFDKNGFHFRYPIPRKGIWFSDKSGKTIISLMPQISKGRSSIL